MKMPFTNPELTDTHASLNHIVIWPTAAGHKTLLLGFLFSGFSLRVYTENKERM